MVVRGVLMAFAMTAFVLLVRTGIGAVGREPAVPQTPSPGQVEVKLPEPGPAAPVLAPSQMQRPARLTGAAEDEALSLTAEAALGDDGAYGVQVTVTNKAGRGVDLLFNCGSLLWWQGVKSSLDSFRTCPAVYSRMLEAGEQADLEGRLAPDAVLRWDALAVTVRYLPPSGGAGSARTVAAPLQAAP